MGWFWSSHFLCEFDDEWQLVSGNELGNLLASDLVKVVATFVKLLKENHLLVIGDLVLLEHACLRCDVEWNIVRLSSYVQVNFSICRFSILNRKKMKLNKIHPIVKQLRFETLYCTVPWKIQIQQLRPFQWQLLLNQHSQWLSLEDQSFSWAS